MTDHPLTIRLASPEDAPALRRLAQLDSATPLAGRVLLAELDGQSVAAVSLESGSTIADPFRHSADAARMLKVRRDQILSAGPRRNGAPVWRRAVVRGEGRS
jgi:hypothetical protein